MVGGAIVLAGGGFAWYQNQNSVTNLEVGDCVNEPESYDKVETLPTVDCDGEHDFEIYQVGELSGEFPGDAELDEQVGQVCFTAFESNFGTYDETNPYDFTYLVPLEESWSQDKGYSCMVYSVEGPLTAPVEQAS